MPEDNTETDVHEIHSQQSNGQNQMINCAVIPEAIYYAWLDSYRDALVTPKSSQPILEALKNVQFNQFPVDQK